MTEERVCTKFRCPYYSRGTVNNIGVTNCGGTGWTNSCFLVCPFRNYAMSLNCTVDDTDGDYVPGGDNG